MRHEPQPPGQFGEINTGVVLFDSPYARFEECEISGFTGHGVEIGGRTSATFVGCRITGNGRLGIFVEGLEECRTAVLEGLGAPESLLQMVRVSEVPFRGSILGGQNYIPGPEAPDGNGIGAICPLRLNYLMAGMESSSD